jgi:hypothetical protein
MRHFSNGLKKHCSLGEDGDGGIFTRCVIYCQENNAAYNVSNVWQLASDLIAGRTPRGPPPSPDSTILESPSERRKSRFMKKQPQLQPRQPKRELENDTD